MPFELMNASSTFRRMMDQLMRHLSFVKVYLGDVLMFLENMDEHLSHIEQVMTLISSHGLRLKLSKSVFASESVNLLGLIVSKKGGRS